MLLSTKKMGGLRKKKHPKYNFCASIGKIGQNKPNYFGLPPVHPTHTWVGSTGGWDAPLLNKANARLTPCLWRLSEAIHAMKNITNQCRQ